MAQLVVNQFRGLRNDQGRKFIPPENFFRIVNFNYDDILGANKILAPGNPIDLGDNASIDGMYEFRYLNEAANSVTESIAVTGGKIYKNWDGIPSLIKSGLPEGKVDFTVLNDELFITSNKFYPQVYDGIAVYEMGAPRITQGAIGVLTGTYYYELTYVTAGGEERLGTKSNILTVTNRAINLKLPLGYTGTTSRKLYRTTAGGSTPKLLATIADNTTLTYVDNTPDGSLGADIIAINNECPKPQFIETCYQKLVGGKMDIYPTQVIVGETNIKVWDAATGVEVSGIGGDNTEIVGIELDYAKVIVGTRRNIFVVDVSDTPTTVTLSRSNVGVKEGFSMVKIPDNDFIDGVGNRISFPGGVMFVSTLNDVRVFNGNFAQPVATSLDNLKTENWAQAIRGSLQSVLNSYMNIHAHFFDYKYHLLIDQQFFVFDIRTMGWSTYQIITESYQLNPYTLGTFNEALFVGHENESIIEQMYFEEDYRGEKILASFETPDLMADNLFKYFKDLFLYFVSPSGNKAKVTVQIETNYNNPIVANLEFKSGDYDVQFYNFLDYTTAENNEDYMVIHLNQYGRWLSFKVENEDGPVLFRGFKLTADEVSNKEM